MGEEGARVGEVLLPECPWRPRLRCPPTVFQGVFLGGVGSSFMCARACVCEV